MCTKHGAVDALIYCRVSQDRSGGRSVAEQEAECRAWCERQGWPVLDVLVDNDVGASRYSKGQRPAWAQVKDRIASGQVDVLVAWESSRTGRDLAEFVELRDLLDAHGVKLSVSGRLLDLTDSSDRFMSGLEALINEKAAEDTSARIRRAMRSQAASGRPHGRRLFGYRRTYDGDTGQLVGQVPEPAEAAVVQRIFTGYLDGKGTRTMAAELNAEGITTGTGAKWKDTQINRVLLNPAYIAKRVHKGEVVGDADWPPIIDAETFQRAQQRRASNLTNQERITGTPRLLTRVGRCGLCGAKLRSLHDRGKRKVYTCSSRYEVSRDGKQLDAFIGELVINRLSGAEGAELLRGEPLEATATVEAYREVQTLRDRLDEAAEQFALGEITATMLAKVEGTLAPMIEALERDARKVPALNIEVPAEGLAEWWEALDPGTRRDIVNALFAAVVVHPVGKGRRTFDPDAIEIEWAA